MAGTSWVTHVFLTYAIDVMRMLKVLSCASLCNEIFKVRFLLHCNSLF